MFGVVCGTNRSVAPIWVPYALLGAMAAFAGCAGETPTDTGEEPVDKEPQFDALTHLISDPMPLLMAAASASAAAADTVSYVSLPPGTYPEGETATITNQANDAEVNATIVEGGFDPVPVPSAVGDTLFIEISDSTGTIIGRERTTVPPEAPPLIVRTRPAKNKVFVPLNLVPEVVFSEPIDQLTVTAQTIRLHQGGADGALVAGTVALQAGGLVAEFMPTAPLEPRTQYTLVVTTGIRDLAGDALANQEVVNFETLGIVAYVVVDNRTDCCWPNNNEDRVAVIDTKTHSLVKTLEFEQANWSDVMFIPNRPFAYMTGDVTVVINAATHEVTGPVVGVQEALFTTASDDGRIVYVQMNFGGYGQVAVVSTDTHEMIANIPVVQGVGDGTAYSGAGVAALAPSPNGSVVYAAVWEPLAGPEFPASMKVIDAATNAVVASTPLSGASGLAGRQTARIFFSPDGAFAYTVNNIGPGAADPEEGFDEGRVYVLDTSDHSLVTTIVTGTMGDDAVLSPDGAYLLVLQTGSGTITVVETATNSVIDRIGGMARPDFMVLTPDGSRLYVTDSWWNTVWVIDVASRSIVAGVRVAVGNWRVRPWRRPHLAVTPDGAFVYVGGNGGANTVVVIDTATNTVVAEIDVGGWINDIAIGPR